MKKILFLIFVSLFQFGNKNLIAQTIGVSSGISYFHFYSHERIVGHSSGIYFEKKLWRNIGVIANSDYSSFKYSPLSFQQFCYETFDTQTYRFLSPSLCLLISLLENKKQTLSWKIFAGYQYSFNCKSSTQKITWSCTSSDTSNYNISFQKTPNGIIAGTEIQFKPISHLTVALGANTSGMKLTIENYSQKLNPNTLYLKVGYNFGCKKLSTTPAPTQ